MEFDKKSLLKLGKLARISISDDKLNNLSKDLNSLYQKLEVRDDKVDTKNSAEDILENAPEKEMDFFVVPKVIE